MILAPGPAMAILACSKGRGSPRNITAPGAARTNPEVIDNNSETSNPFGYMRYSDHNPCF